ncbi:hypothetical protein BO71DRAFT_461712 [Aspergillus ellipticus CBS 707.79]|uniref:Major facilitator superfamily (MFS) profile domain-containing protein n=1 Tax=Aspergillus ellipticus CBS 707.79 TaxID=1448320 RepID=A0A319D0A5_9EURO|nr:hypothetical protein BO71DRAFT_461712 [Aspergillus ellipticus CBS 707.79]
MEDWFHHRKGLAFGVMWAGTGLGGVILPIVIEQLLNRYGFRAALRAFAIALFLLTAPLVYFVKPRVPIPATQPRPPPPNLRFLGTSTFALFQLCNIVEALGVFRICRRMPGRLGRRRVCRRLLLSCLMLRPWWGAFLWARSWIRWMLRCVYLFRRLGPRWVCF